jgi:phosphate-selective porin OprO/OprP
MPPTTTWTPASCPPITRGISAWRRWGTRVQCRVLAEYNRAWVNSPAKGNPTFSGYYLAASWVITGEARPYDRTVGYGRRVMPTSRGGAPELVVRFSHVDLDDGVVQGGSFDKTYLGLNWWATRRRKVGLGWGHTWLDRSSATGNTDSILARLQWVY